METVTKERRWCKGVSVDGIPCQAHPQTNSDYCWFHDAEIAESRRVAQTHGGRSRAYQCVEAEYIGSTDDVLKGIGQVIANLKAMDATVTQCRALTDAYMAALKVFELKELEDRIAALEEAVTSEEGGSDGY